MNCTAIELRQYLASGPCDQVNQILLEVFDNLVAENLALRGALRPAMVAQVLTGTEAWRSVYTIWNNKITASASRATKAENKIAAMVKERDELLAALTNLKEKHHET